MQCLYPRQMKHPSTRLWITHRCGQCISCRINKQSAWIFRNLLECQHSQSSAFWTLTLDQQGLECMADVGPKKMMRNFFAALRNSEDRHGNPNPIRYCGVLEFGGQFGRPHFHILLYNMVKNLREPYPYRRGQPRPEQSIGLWPHGRVDFAEFNPSTIAYTVKYIFKDSRTEGLCIPFRTIRPGIGGYGIASLAASVAAKQSNLPSVPVSFRYRNRNYVPDHFTRQTFKVEYEKNGGTIDKATPMDRKLQSLLLDQELAALPWHQRKKTWERVKQLEFLERQAAAKKARTETAASQRAINYARARAQRDTDQQNQEAA